MAPTPRSTKNDERREREATHLHKKARKIRRIREEEDAKAVKRKTKGFFGSQVKTVKVHRAQG